ncbi:ribosome small subunit-dependent GTPase A [Mariniblastus fucicola]|uniref:Small ribosomal subunit biogenesis GTPase RsgA n=1 Tax=Mariniblastus fucicola TaxID=980251 RepID=A0A5B9PK11_9BACT|nr:ribosome small subunit-dependent GTPase A [Mariniblastus fucicola]QEG22833.1 Putative ribosome biogenesis GTPase RsgA [Mariniblastus fucicola]
MAKKKKGKQVRASFRKRQNTRVRKRDFTKEFNEDADGLSDQRTAERVSGKGDLTRKRTIVGSDAETDASGFEVELDVDAADSLRGRVLRVHGLSSFVSDANGKVWNCSVRGVLKSLSTDLQHVVVAGDYVTIRQFEGSETDQAVIVRVEPRRNQISRTSRKRQQIIVSNVDRALIVASAKEPGLKPNLIDRFLVTAEQAGITPVIVINKADLVDTADLQPAIGVWCQMGYRVILTSTITGQGVQELRRVVHGRDCVVAGQSGVGKSSILNAIEPGLELRVSKVSSENQKGRHTTTTAQLIPLSVKPDESNDVIGQDDDSEGDEYASLYRKGHLIDTPGIRQMQLWDVIPEEVAGYFRDIRPFINECRFPNCSHTHEDDCAIKWAVADGKIDARRYESYCSIRYGDEP